MPKKRKAFSEEIEERTPSPEIYDIHDNEEAEDQEEVEAVLDAPQKRSKSKSKARTSKASTKASKAKTSNVVEPDPVGRFQSMIKLKPKEYSSYKRGDYVLIHPEGCKDLQNRELLWKGKIEDIRKDGNGKIYFGLHWFYRAEDVEPLRIPKGAKLQADHFGEHELLETNHLDVVEEASVLRKMNIHKLTDSKAQAPIAEDDFYTRAHYSIKQTIFKLYTKPCRVCRTAYRPESADTDDVQIYCASCERWQHYTCCSTQEQKTHAKDLKTLIQQNGVSGIPKASPKKKRKADPPASKGKGRASEANRALDLLENIAGATIYRGAEYGVAGEVKAICTARQILADVRRGKRDLSDNSWKEDIGLDVIRVAKDWPKEVEACKLCPNCNSPL